METLKWSKYRSEQIDQSNSNRGMKTQMQKDPNFQPYDFHLLQFQTQNQKLTKLKKKKKKKGKSKLYPLCKPKPINLPTSRYNCAQKTIQWNLKGKKKAGTLCKKAKEVL